MKIVYLCIYLIYVSFFGETNLIYNMETEQNNSSEMEYGLYYAKSTFTTDGGKVIPEGLEEYIAEALLNNCLIDYLSAIEAEYVIWDSEDREFFLNFVEDETLHSYQYYTGNEDDKWYQVSLYGPGDIVIEHWNEKGYVEVFFFERSGSFSHFPALRSGGQEKSNPYFIQWDGVNYMAIPYWDENTEKIVGVTIHKFKAKNAVVGIGIQEDSTITINNQVYNVGCDTGTTWPDVDFQ